MAPRLLLSLLVLCSVLLPGPASAALGLGQTAPDMALSDVQGKPVRLSDYRGRHVVLEWTNPGCPFVRKHYRSGNMQALQAEARGRGVVWLTVNSTADGSADYLSPQQMARWLAEQKAAPSAALMDDSGELGRAMGARNSLHFFILNPRGELIYAGAIDSIPSAKAEDLPNATNYVRQGLKEALAGQPLSVATSRPYGCPITYR
ncbi:redoxin domain-containing protein [Curvibacter sp. PAE-UM]|uniref:redoxin domain-containing protein n=1 Tax=Curvibacter sp. PAE-UM TaxID=1714344 RepID=UPI00070C3B8F|nr:redoxin domain-containing protein [Curvibacter sp. PAE-UM]KRH98825.1 alkyl hydroperoxide reductase [Curvibacter sp. PAE-UM]